jgi:hypothetical protein
MTLPLVTIAASIMTMVAVSFERYRSIVKQRYLSNKAFYIIIALIWLFALVLAAPQLYEYSVVEEHEIEGNETEIEIICGSAESSDIFPTTYGSIVVFCVYVIPSIIVLANYINVGRFVWKMSKLRSDGQTEVQGAVAKQKVNVVKMLAVIAVVFLVLWAPFFILFFLEVRSNQDSHIIDNPNIIKYVQLSHRCIRPMATPNTNISHTFKKNLFPCLCRKRFVR